MPPAAEHADRYDFSFSTAQFKALVAAAESMPPVATAATKLAHVIEAVASCEIEGIVNTTALPVPEIEVPALVNRPVMV